MTKNSLTILLFVLLFVGGILYVEYAVPKIERVVHGPAIRVIDKELVAAVEWVTILTLGFTSVDKFSGKKNDEE